MLITKPILSPIELDDGVRISIMSRHTLPDGVTLDQRITRDRYTFHWPELAPPARLVGDYYRRGITWEEFSARYRLYLAISRTAQYKVAELLSLAMSLDQHVTIMCIEDLPTWCHRRLLAEYCQQKKPELPIKLR
jgi:uncharacterized protein YeaO (DUF488 family)